MRTPLLMAALLALSLAGSGQRPPSCRQLFTECADALPGLYDRRDFDSIAWHVSRRLQQCNPFDLDLYCLNILLAIELHRFSPELARNRYFFFLPDAYVNVAAACWNDEEYIPYNSSPEFDATGYDKEIFSTLSLWAEDLLEIRQMDSTETFFCKVFAGRIQSPEKFVRRHRRQYPGMDSLYRTSYGFVRKQTTGNLFIGAGIWIPKGNAAVLGIHPSILAVGLGGRRKFHQLDFNISFRFISTRDPYTVFVQDSLYTLHHFFGGYLGLDYTRYLVMTRNFEAGLVLGVGYDGFDYAENSGNSGSDNSGPPGGSINSLNLNAGCRFNFFVAPRKYIGVLARYNAVWYHNPGGTPLDGHAISFDIYFGRN